MIGVNIRKRREAAGLKPQQLADAVYISRPMLVQVEHGIKKPSLELTERIAKFFNCTVDELLK